MRRPFCVGVHDLYVYAPSFLCWCAGLVCRFRGGRERCGTSGEGEKEGDRQTDRQTQREVDAEEVSMGTEEEVRGGWVCNEFPLPFMTKIPASAADGESH